MGCDSSTCDEHRYCSLRGPKYATEDDVADPGIILDGSDFVTLKSPPSLLVEGGKSVPHGDAGSPQSVSDDTNACRAISQYPGSDDSDEQEDIINLYFPDDSALEEAVFFSCVYRRLHGASKAEPPDAIVDALTRLTNTVAANTALQCMVKDGRHSRIVHATCALLRDRDEKVRQCAGALLLQIADGDNTTVMDCLCLGLQVTDSFCAAALDVAGHLAKKGDLRVAAAAFRQLQNLDPAVRLVALQVLAKIARADDAAVVSAALKGDLVTVKALADRVDDGDARMRADALEVLPAVAEQGDHIALRAVFAGLSDSDSDVMWKALKSLAILGVRGNQRSIDAAAALLDETQQHVRQAALHTLGELVEKEDTIGVQAISAKLHDEALDVRSAAQDALDRIAEAPSRLGIRASLRSGRLLSRLWELRPGRRRRC